MKVLIRFSNDFIQFYDYSDYKNPEYSRTNVLDLNEIVLSDEFVDQNYNFIYNFIKNKVTSDHINKVFIDKLSIDKMVFQLIHKIECLNYIYIKENKKLDNDLFRYILLNKNIKIIDCYDISPISFERLNLSRNIKLLVRKKYCDDTYIYRLNNLNTYSDIYYSEELLIDKKLLKKDLDKLNEYLKINRFLNIIHIKFFNKDNINKLLTILKSNNKTHIVIEIIENDNNIKSILQNINEIKRKNKRYLKKNKIHIKIIYEDKYITNNVFKELNLNFIKTTLLSVIFLTITIYSLFFIINEKNIAKTNDTMNKINDILSTIEIEEPTKEPEQPKVQEEIKTEKPKKESAYFKNYNKAISELKKVNGDTVGWLSLNNSKINYPIVKTKNNSKYLNFSFDGSKNPNGWLFMDYRNSAPNLDRNTIIYGHSGNYYVMFGSLHKILQPNWYTNPNNQIVTFNTETNNKKWHIFSIYTIDVTSDYLVTKFDNDDVYTNFLTRLKQRSIYDFGQELTANDKILTLSTCYKDGSKRLVLHAKLMQ